ncbi:MAG: TetR/AcrR family transcriptional regulator [Sandaracinaceae bacterium]
MGRPREVTDEQILTAARRCFLAGGAGVPASEIARELGVSHTTLFNRFGSKEGLMLAALGPPCEVAWIAALDAGPDARPIREQLVEHAKAMSVYFQELQAGFGVLAAAGVDPRKSHKKKKGVSEPERGYASLVAWLDRARADGRLADCDVDALASSLLGALHGWALTARVCGGPTGATARDRYVEGFVDLLWDGIGVAERPGRARRPRSKDRKTG